MTPNPKNLPVLTVKLGQPVELFLKAVPPGMEAVMSQFGHLASGLHAVRILSDDWNLTVAQTRFSSVDFEEGRVRGLEVNPHPEKLTLEQAAALLDTLESEFNRFGFQAFPNHKMSGKALRDRSAEIAGDSSYRAELYRAQRANVLCSMTLKKSDDNLFLLTIGVRMTG